MVLIKDPSSSLSFRWTSSSSSCSYQSNIVFVSGGISPQVLEMFSISPLQAYPLRCCFPNNPAQSFLARMLSKFNCDRSCHFLLRSFVPMIYLWFFHPEALCCRSFQPIISFCQRSSSFRAYTFNQSVVPFCSSSFRLIKPCISFQPECCLNLVFPDPLP